MMTLEELGLRYLRPEEKEQCAICGRLFSAGFDCVICDRCRRNFITDAEDYDETE